MYDDNDNTLQGSKLKVKIGKLNFKKTYSC